MKAQLGDKVKDRISGFTGIVFSKTSYLTGCDRIQVVPDKLTPEGKRLDPDNFDIDEVEVLERAKIKEATLKDVGGPRPVTAKRK